MLRGMADASRPRVKPGDAGNGWIGFLGPEALLCLCGLSVESRVACGGGAVCPWAPPLRSSRGEAMGRGWRRPVQRCGWGLSV